jgi:hypothetical protein
MSHLSLGRIEEGAPRPLPNQDIKEEDAERLVEDSNLIISLHN